MSTEKSPCEDTARRQTFASKERGLRKNQICQYLDLGLVSLQNDEKINAYCLSYPVHGILSWQPVIG